MNKWFFAWRKQRAILLPTMIVVFVTTWFVKPWAAQPQVAWWQVLDAIVGMATLVVALVVWFAELTESWEDSLPKRLKVIYLFDSKPVMVCEDAVLVAESDIRGMAQQMGAQMSGDRSLALGPIIESVQPKTSYAPGIGPLRRYEIRMMLTSVPERVAEIRQRKNDSGIVVVRRIVGGRVNDQEMPQYDL